MGERYSRCPRVLIVRVIVHCRARAPSRWCYPRRSVRLDPSFPPTQRLDNNPQPPGAQVDEKTRHLDLQRAAVSQLQDAIREGAPPDQVQRALLSASRSLDALGAEPESTARPGAPTTLLAPAVREELRRAASSLTTVPPGDSRAVAAATRPVLALLERVRSQLEGEIALGLSFEGSYRQSKPTEPAYGGHASAMGPAPANVPSPADGAPVTVAFEEGARLPASTYCGGPTKDHILESACGGVARFDYDGDGLLDVYLVTAAELTPARERIPHANTLYRNLGGWKFEDVSKQAGVDAGAARSDRPLRDGVIYCAIHGQRRRRPERSASRGWAGDVVPATVLHRYQ